MIYSQCSRRFCTLESMANTTRVAVITGAGQGIGRKTAEVLAARGYALALNDLKSVDATMASVRAAGAEAIDALGDVSSETQVARMAESVQHHFGRIDLLVNNAGISFIRPAEETGAEEWRRVLEVNLTGPFLTCRAFGKLMLAQGSGAIVNVASVAGLSGIGDRSAYNASKHGLIGLTRTLASEWGGRGVRTNAVCPGWVKTEMDEADQAGGYYSDADIENRVPMGRFARPNEIAEAIAFLGDPALSGFVNGMELRVDGGWLADGSWDRLRVEHRAAR
jgi:NAD(P)-dependent dehydrogenase (short-subunit alcohol dehydrogenase family)